jgi:DNA repair exonuclease SbcCD ATPase subunit
MTTWWETLDAARARRDEAEEGRVRCGELDGVIRQLEERLAGCEASLARERADVERLRGLSWAAMLHALLGDADARLRREEREVVEAQFHKEEAEADLARARAEREEVARGIDALGDAGEAYERALVAAAKRAAREKGPASAELRELQQRIARLQRIDRRLARARDAGGRALDGLEEVRAAVGGAERMSVWDLFGGGMIASALKHQRIDAARERLRAAREDLEAFRQRLGPLAQAVEVELDFDGFVRACDAFVDWIYHDFIVAQRLSAAHRAVAGAADGVAGALASLDARRERVLAELTAASERRRALIECRG